jgi:hypothetical protein
MDRNACMTERSCIRTVRPTVETDFDYFLIKRYVLVSYCMKVLRYKNIIFFNYDLFNDALKSSQYAAGNDRMAK